LKIDALNEEIRTIVKDGSFARTAPEITITLLFFAKLLENNSSVIDL